MPSENFDMGGWPSRWVSMGHCLTYLSSSVKASQSSSHSKRTMAIQNFLLLIQKIKFTIRDKIKFNILHENCFKQLKSFDIVFIFIIDSLNPKVSCTAFHEITLQNW